MKRCVFETYIICIFSIAILINHCPAQETNPADILAAQSLLHSAQSMVYAPPKTPARAKRLIALAKFAEKFSPEEPEVNRLFANIIYTSQGKLAQSALAGEKYLKSFPDDYKQGVFWLNLNLDTLNDAEKRIEFLDSVTQRKDFSNNLKAQAAALSARIHLGQGEKKQFDKSLKQALDFDPINPMALNYLLSQQASENDSRNVSLLLGLIQANPADIATSIELGAVLDSLGLHNEAAEFMAHAWKASERFNSAKTAPPELINPYLNTLLSAERYDEAIAKFQPMLTELPEGTEIRPLLIEAYHALGQAEQAEQLINAMNADFEQKAEISGDSTALAIQRAWFNLIVVDKPNIALKYAQKASELRLGDPIVELLLGAAELKTNSPEKGLPKLQDLLREDLYAAVFLAEYFLENGEIEAGSDMILTGTSLGRNGPAFRRLIALARRYDIELPPAKDALKTKKLLDDFDQKHLEMALEPEKYISVTLKSTKDDFVPGEPVEIEAVLSNKSKLSVPLGNWGLFSPTMSLEVNIEAYTEKNFSNLPLANWPAPRYLDAGESITCKVRLDVGRLERFLLQHPLENLTLKVTAILDPLQRDKDFISSVPTVTVEPLVIRRSDILGEFDRSAQASWAKAYQRQLGLIVRDIKQGTLPKRMLATRKVASMLAFANLHNRGKAKLPEDIESTFDSRVLLSMLKVVMEDESDVVRAEMLTALENVPLDDAILSLLAPAIHDSSPLVRFRMAELLGSSDASSHSPVIEFLSKDSDPLVELMAAAFINNR